MYTTIFVLDPPLIIAPNELHRELPTRVTRSVSLDPTRELYAAKNAVAVITAHWRATAPDFVAYWLEKRGYQHTGGTVTDGAARIAWQLWGRPQ